MESVSFSVRFPSSKRIKSAVHNLANAFGFSDGLRSPGVQSSKLRCTPRLTGKDLTSFGENSCCIWSCQKADIYCISSYSLEYALKQEGLEAFEKALASLPVKWGAAVAYSGGIGVEIPHVTRPSMPHRHAPDPAAAPRQVVRLPALHARQPDVTRLSGSSGHRFEDGLPLASSLSANECTRQCQRPVRYHRGGRNLLSGVLQGQA